MMAKQSIDPLTKRQLAATSVLKAAPTWEPFRGPTGKLLFRVPGSRPGTTYTVCATSCTCPDAYLRHSICKHRRAVAAYLTAVKAFLAHRRQYRKDRAHDG
jgi:hypothetical protein